MIVREVILNPKLIENFDWFNDEGDTMAWLHGILSKYVGTPHPILYKDGDTRVVKMPALINEIIRQQDTEEEKQIIETSKSIAKLIGIYQRRIKRHCFANHGGYINNLKEFASRTVTMLKLREAVTEIDSDLAKKREEEDGKVST